MSANSFGSRLIVHSFGESHGVALGCVIDGLPAGINFDHELLKRNLNRRRPGQSEFVTPRQEADEFEILSGVFEGKTLGTPVAIIVRNQDQKSSDYDEIKTSSRVGHADDIWKLKFSHVDHRGGGRASARETVSRVIAGSFAQMLCMYLYPEIEVFGFVSQMGSFQLSSIELRQALASNQIHIEKYLTRFPSDQQRQHVEECLRKAKDDGESFGAKIELVIKNPPAALGQPVFHKLKADFASAIMGVNAINGVVFGSGFQASESAGTEFHKSHEVAQYGGIRGGLSTGETIHLQASIKPTSSILDTAKKGRHDPCLGIRAVPILESMLWLVLADHIIWQKTDQVSKL